MAEEKILVPSYKRAGSCKSCGADVYAPDLKQSGGWPLMSACACKHGPRIAGLKRLQARNRVEDEKPEQRAQAA
jgi:hypothetical protein